MIYTVNGPIQKHQLGITMAHEHFILDLSGVRGELDSYIQDVNLVVPEIKCLIDLGCQSVIEVTGADMGRDPKKLLELSQKVGLNIVASTGFYLKPYHPKWVLEAEIQEIEAFFIKELTKGMGDSEIVAGLIAEVATSKDRIYPSEEKVLRAAARAALRTNRAISTHCDMGTMALEQIRIFKEEQVNLEKVIIGHVDLIDDLNYHQKILDTGANIAFDTIGKTAYVSDDRRAQNVIQLIQKGYEKQIVMSQDISRKSYFQANGRKGYSAVLGEFIPKLRALGIKQSAIEQMLIHNPAQILDA